MCAQVTEVSVGTLTTYILMIIRGLTIAKRPCKVDQFNIHMAAATLGIKFRTKGHFHDASRFPSTEAHCS